MLTRKHGEHLLGDVYCAHSIGVTLESLPSEDLSGRSEQGRGSVAKDKFLEQQNRKRQMDMDRRTVGKEKMCVGILGPKQEPKS